jgi:hypothetical protein
MLKGLTLTLAFGIPVILGVNPVHAQTIVDQLLGTGRAPQQNAYEQGRRDEARRQHALREERRAERQAAREGTYGSHGQHGYYPRQRAYSSQYGYYNR